MLHRDWEGGDWGARGRRREREEASHHHPTSTHRHSILHTLRVRYELDMIYTYSGNILIAVSLCVCGKRERIEREGQTFRRTH